VGPHKVLDRAYRSLNLDLYGGAKSDAPVVDLDAPRQLRGRTNNGEGTLAEGTPASLEPLPSEGWAELTYGSAARVVAALADVASSSSSPPCESLSFLDIGSGLGRVVATAAASGRYTGVYGVELSPQMAVVSRDFLNKGRAWGAFGDRLSCEIVCGDARAVLAENGPLGRADAIFLFDKVFPLALVAALGAVLRECPWVALCACSSPSELAAAGFEVEVVRTMRVSTTGRQTFVARVYRNKVPWRSQS
jgi:SAM-dependent methyltransferase